MSMSSFEERQKGYENKFINDLEVDFKVRSKRNKLLGLWAAEKMHLEGEEAEKYASEVVLSSVDGVANQAVLDKIAGDFNAKDIDIENAEIINEMQKLLLVAQESFK